MRIRGTIVSLALLAAAASSALAYGSRSHSWGSRGDDRWHRSGDHDGDRRDSSSSGWHRRGDRHKSPRDVDPSPTPTPEPPAVVPGFGDALAGLTPEEEARFDAGRDAFEEVETADDGLGPVFNDTSCVACHDVGGIGGGSETLETRFGTTTLGAFDPMAAHGGSLIQTDGIGIAGACAFVGEIVPPEATIVAGRRATPLFGLGLVDAVPDEVLIELARRQARRNPETAGRPNLVTDVTTGGIAVGKFGWKAQVPNLMHFSADAYLNEMGITTPLFPDESCPQGDCALLACDPIPGVDDDLEDVELFHDFMTFLAPPPRVRWTTRLFDQIGCADCHVSSFKTGRNAVVALSRRRFQPFSDFLLHDMGDLGDGIEQGQASGREMRTAPLWGLRLLTTFLHDGRATSIEAAILAHDGQGRRARDAFAALPADAKAKLLAFLGTL